MTHPLSNLRGDDRKSLFVKATLHFEQGCCSIKIRNISPTGALIESAQLPRRGTQVEIRRGAERVLGTLIWRREGKAGIAFQALTDVSLWFPKSRPLGPMANSFQVFKKAPVAASSPPLTPAITPRDIEAVAALLDELSDTFSKDAGVLFNYASKLQGLEIASQMLRKLATAEHYRAR